MPEIFHGPWSVMVVGGNTFATETDHLERFVIAGSDANDGVYAGFPGNGVDSVSGAAWTITMEYRVPLLPQWWPTTVRRSAEYTMQAGLTVYLGSEDTVSVTQMTVMCRSLDPALHPLHPITKPYEFTVTREAMARYRRRQATVGRGRSSR